LLALAFGGEFGPFALLFGNDFLPPGLGLGAGAGEALLRGKGGLIACKGGAKIDDGPGRAAPGSTR